MNDKVKPIFGLNPNVFFVGLVSFLTDISSELIFALMPLFLANVLGAGTVIIGLIEGVAETTASVLKVFSGYFSDKFGNRKYLSFIGYALSSLSKPFMLIANAWVPIMSLRFADRFGKGIRAAPRDALVADSVDENQRGKAFGFHKAMDTSGAAMGLLCTAIVVFMLQREVIGIQLDTYRWLVIIGIIPAFLALFAFIFIREPARGNASGGREVCTTDQKIASKWKKTPLSNKFKIFLVIVFLFTLGNSSDAFLILRAQDLGNNVLFITVMLIIFNVIIALFSIPAGMLSDKVGRRNIIVMGWGVYALVYLGFAVVSVSWAVWLLWALYGIYYGLTTGVARALVCDLVPDDQRGTAFGIYHGVVGVTLLPASLIAGWLWQVVSPNAPFYLGSAMAVLAIIGMLVFMREKTHS